MLGFNELQLYVEHTFAYSGHREVWEGASSFTGWPQTGAAQQAGHREVWEGASSFTADDLG